jgi:NAD-dependent dihydropyrimidine dehydrogenase PreA subunit
MGIQHIDLKRCSRCRHCVEICPQDVLRFDEQEKRVHIQYLRDCQSCFLCEMECPEQAIHVTPYRERRAVLAW